VSGILRSLVNASCRSKVIEDVEDVEVSGLHLDDLDDLDDLGCYGTLHVFLGNDRGSHQLTLTYAASRAATGYESRSRVGLVSR
jgi:hypothetical protein